MHKILIISFIFLHYAFMPGSFEQEQKRYPRVRQAYKEKESDVTRLLNQANVAKSDFSLYLRAFKQEKELELWARGEGNNHYQLIKTYDICRTSGDLGPKQEQGDRQIPEGYYHISHFNPYSNFYLSLKLNYPNKSDRILGVKGNLGGNIFIHGACVTIGCIPITDEQIKELYVFCVEAKDSGQSSIPVTVFPARLSNEKMNELREDHISTEKLGLWKDLKKGYDIFNETKRLPTIGFLSNGRHKVYK